MERGAQLGGLVMHAFVVHDFTVFIFFIQVAVDVGVSSGRSFVDVH